MRESECECSADREQDQHLRGNVVTSQRISERLLGRSQERRMRMMMEAAAAAAAASDHGAHFCAPPVHTEGMRPRLSSATLITGSFGKRDAAGGLG